MKSPGWPIGAQSSNDQKEKILSCMDIAKKKGRKS
jgi:hypothetical protein